jgi:cytidylate kinase
MTVIAIDGPAASGKGTLARRVAAHLRFAHLDTGKLYRAVARRLLAAGMDPDDAEAAANAAQTIDPSELDDPALGDDAVGAAASRVAAIPAVREALLQFQRRFAHRPPGGVPGAVLDGRDIGTVICPDAQIKLFVTADAAVRAERRHKELLTRGENSIYSRVLQDMKERDARDANRAVAPLQPAEDAWKLDTSEMTADEAFAAAISHIEARLERNRR